MIKEPNTLTAMEAAASISSGSLSSVDLVQSCLDQISKTDDQIKAWEYIDGENALEQLLNVIEFVDMENQQGRFMVCLLV